MSQSILKRRTLIKQLGAAAFLATPVFRSVLAEAQVQVPKRFIVVFIPGGLPQVSEGVPDWSFSGGLSPLASLQSDMILFDGFNNQASPKWQGISGGEGHEGGMRTALTGSSLGQPEGRYDAGISSLDQLVAKQIGTTTRFSSLELGVLTDGGEGMEGLFQPLGHRRTIIRDGQAVTPDQNPAVLFNRMFSGAAPAPAPGGTGTSTGPSPDAVNRYQRNKSKLDYLMSRIGSIKSIAGTAEQAKLDQHLTALRELERGLVDPAGGGGTTPVGSGAPPTPTAGCATPTVTGQAGMVKIGEDMTQLAYQAVNCDLTRVLSFQWLGSGDQVQTFPWLSINEHHHSQEHGSMDPGSPQLKQYFIKTQAWMLGEVAKLLTLLKNTDAGSGSLLDNSLVLLTSDMSSGDHSPDPHTAFLIGKAGGSVRAGRTISAPQGTAHNNLLLGVAGAMGLNLTTIGDADLCKAAVSLT